MKSNEFLPPDTKAVEDFIKFVYGKLHINSPLPNIEFAKEKESPDQNRTGYYDPSSNKMWVYTGNRNLIDIMRTIAHELAHHKQRENEHTYETDKISNIESQADMAAGMIIKLYVRQHPEIIK
jgi:hypothetical protein